MSPGLTLLLFFLLAASASSNTRSFTCARPSTCQPAFGYVVPKTTTYEELIFLFRPSTLHDLLAANQLPSDTAAKQAIPARTTLSIPFRCRCTGNGVGQSDIYTVQTGNDELEIFTVNNILAADNYDKLISAARLPCSCDKEDGSDVIHFAYIVRSGDNTLEIAAKYGVQESTLLRINNITNHTSLRQGQILDIPLKGAGAKLAKASAEHPFVAVFVGVFAAIVLSFFFGTWYYWISALSSLSSGTKNGTMQLDYNDLACATNRFSKKSKIGHGKFGAVYKANYKGQEVAVKKWAGAGEIKDFHEELQTVSNTRHTNLVRMKGWCGRISLMDSKSCWKNEIKVELLLVFELILNGTLEDHLYKREQVLPWDKRYKIVKGIGSALPNFHYECNPCILHRDIKPGNILLDDNFNAKLADFGLSLTFGQNKETIIATANGTMGYMDPQLEKDGSVEYNRKSDVYSFGIVLPEIACTEKSMDSDGRKLREKVWEMYGSSSQPQVEAAADTKLRGDFDRKQMERMVVLGLKCSHPEETHRPSMVDAMNFLEDG